MHQNGSDMHIRKKTPHELLALLHMVTFRKRDIPVKISDVLCEYLDIFGTYFVLY